MSRPGCRACGGSGVVEVRPPNGPGNWEPAWVKVPCEECGTPGRQRATAAGLERREFGGRLAWSHNGFFVVRRWTHGGLAWQDPGTGVWTPAPDEEAALIAYLNHIGAPAAPRPVILPELTEEEDAAALAAVSGPVPAATVEPADYLWFSFSGETGFDLHTTADEAKAAAHDELVSHREEAGDGWTDSVTETCWGRILGRVVQTSSKSVAEIEAEGDEALAARCRANDWDAIIDFSLVDLPAVHPDVEAVLVEVMSEDGAVELGPDGASTAERVRTLAVCYLRGIGAAFQERDLRAAAEARAASLTAAARRVTTAAFDPAGDWDEVRAALEALHVEVTRG